MIRKIKSRTSLPVGVGFGIRDGATARRIAGFADAVVIGSRLIEEIETSPKGEAIERVAALVKSIRGAMDK
jgi:tryptophan synthase alpha chain